MIFDEVSGNNKSAAISNQCTKNQTDKADVDTA